LGYCKDTPSIARTVLLDRLNNPKSVSEQPALYKALSYLASYQPDIDEIIRPILLAICHQPEAAAALARLSLVKAKREERPLLETKRNQKRETISAVRHSVLINELSIESFVDVIRLEDDKTWNRVFSESESRKEQEIMSFRLLSLLEDSISEPFQCLIALIEAGSDDNLWNDQYHGILVNAVRIHLEHNPDLLPILLTSLKRAILKEKWPSRRFKLAAVTACIEVMPITVQRACSDDLEALLIKGTTDTNSSTSRRFALTALSYLRSVTSDIVPALLAGCRDTKAVQRDTIASAGHFQLIDGNPLPQLIAALTSESSSTAYAIAQLLGALGTSIASDTANLRRQIIEALVEALKDPRSQREVFIDGENQGELEDALYTSLLQVAGWMG